MNWSGYCLGKMRLIIVKLQELAGFMKVAIEDFT